MKIDRNRVILWAALICSPLSYYAGWVNGAYTMDMVNTLVNNKVKYNLETISDEDRILSYEAASMLSKEAHYFFLGLSSNPVLTKEYLKTIEEVRSKNQTLHKSPLKEKL